MTGSGHHLQIDVSIVTLGDEAGLLDELFDQYGDTVNYVGAGCGLGQRRNTPCVLNSDGCHERAAVVARIELKCSWNEIAEDLGKNTPQAARMMVTRALRKLAAEMADVRP